jgi:putative membrane protein
MFYNNYYWGMHFFWWVLWIGMLAWIFVIPYDIPYQRRRKDSPLDILQKRFASGEISANEYNQKRKIIENDLSGLS